LTFLVLVGFISRFSDNTLAVNMNMRTYAKRVVKFCREATRQAACVLCALTATAWPIPADSAQSPAITWAQSGGGAGGEFGWGAAVDATGNALVTGHFTAPATFGSTSFSQGALLDIFLAKYSANGDLLWIRSASGPGNDDARGVTADAK